MFDLIFGLSQYPWDLNLNLQEAVATLRICYYSQPTLRLREEICSGHCSYCQQAVMIEVQLLSFCSVLKLVFVCALHEP